MDHSSLADEESPSPSLGILIFGTEATLQILAIVRIWGRSQHFAKTKHERVGQILVFDSDILFDGQIVSVFQHRQTEPSCFPQADPGC